MKAALNVWFLQMAIGYDTLLTPCVTSPRMSRCASPQMMDSRWPTAHRLKKDTWTEEFWAQQSEDLELPPDVTEAAEEISRLLSVGNGLSALPPLEIAMRRKRLRRTQLSKSLSDMLAAHHALVSALVPSPIREHALAASVRARWAAFVVLLPMLDQANALFVRARWAAFVVLLSVIGRAEAARDAFGRTRLCNFVTLARFGGLSSTPAFSSSSA